MRRCLKNIIIESCLLLCLENIILEIRGDVRSTRIRGYVRTVRSTEFVEMSKEQNLSRIQKFRISLDVKNTDLEEMSKVLNKWTW